MLKLAWKNIIKNPLSTSLSAVLFAVSIVIIILLGIVGSQLEEKFNKNRRKVHMVVGAPGSEMDLLLSSIYHVTPPIENINVKDITFLLGHPSVNCVPLAMGDHWAKENPNSKDPHDVERRRIVGTDTSYLTLYDVKLESGKIWKEPMEVTIGAEVHGLGLNIGDQFAGVHGVSGEGDAHVHEDQLYTVVGILESSGTVLDQLILCSIESVWAVHGTHGHDHGHSSPKKNEVEHQPKLDPMVAHKLAPHELDSLKELVNQKLINIEKITLLDSFNLNNPLKNQDGFTSALLRTRSNLKTIIKAEMALAGHYLSVKDTSVVDGSKFTMRDSFRLVTEADLQELKFKLNRIKEINSNDQNPESGLEYARLVERLTYEIPNNFKRVWIDSIVQVRRAQMEKSGKGMQRHYLMDHKDQEITSLLVSYKENEKGQGLGGFALYGQIRENYKGKLGVSLVENQVQTLFELIEPAVEYLKLLAYIIMTISGVSVLISLVKSLRERKYELALMRVMGATRIKIFLLVIIEGVLLALLGFILGFVLAHLIGEFMAGYLEERYHYNFTGFVFLKTELWILFGTLIVGFIAAVIPGLMSIRTNISSTLSNK